MNDSVNQSPTKNPIWRLLRRYIFTRENAWVLIVTLMLLLLWLIILSQRQAPRFIYQGF